jgi:hypothetical protein
MIAVCTAAKTSLFWLRHEFPPYATLGFIHKFAGGGAVTLTVIRGKSRTFLVVATVSCSWKTTTQESQVKKDLLIS